MIEAMDAQIGRVLEALDATGLTDNTIVVFTSDNGGERFSDTWPFTGKKTELLEGGLRIPVRSCWPARIPAGQHQRPGGDHAWTGCRRCWPPPAPRPMPTIRRTASTCCRCSTAQRAPRPRKLFWRYKTNAQRAARDGDFKYLKIRDNTFLFDVVADPRERANLKHRRKDVFDRLVADWPAWNATMLPEIADSFGEVFTAAELADHIGAD